MPLLCLMVPYTCSSEIILFVVVLFVLAFLVLQSEICQFYLEAFKICSYIYVKYKEAFGDLLAEDLLHKLLGLFIATVTCIS